MTPCPHCHAPDTRVVRSRANTLRIAGSVLLVPFYVLGGLAGDARGPLLPLERRCASCGRTFRERSVLDELRGRRTHRPPDPLTPDS
jgi:hypothetical protein